jgi:hypothetical protein
MAPIKMLRRYKDEVSAVFDKLDGRLSKYAKYKEVYDFLRSCPMMEDLIKENKALKKENRRLNKALLYLLENRQTVIQIDGDSSEPIQPKMTVPKEVIVKEELAVPKKVIVKEEPTKKPNITIEVVKDVLVDQGETEEEQEVEAEEEEEQNTVEAEEQEEEQNAVEEEEDDQGEAHAEEEDEQEVEVEAEEENAVEEEEEEEQNAVEEEEQNAVEEEEQNAVEEEEQNAVEEEEQEEEQNAVEEEEQEEEEEVYEVVIYSKTYYVTNEKDSVIYGVDADGEIGDELGKYVNGVPSFSV